ncbi:proline hydroxylase buaE-like isoform X2 [Haliotis rubra]|uniref:proline hydroxylase buaE-like isoform X2 n=1 Tax=Haliotis rubra TaxID=36100 RepID=UPI001EE61E5A|nr:proline hydroxylase buaE-like isoform X2 [Haliotis rubra]
MANTVIPIVDFEKYGLHITDPGSVRSEVLEDTANGICDAFSTVGFVYLVNHGIEQSKIDVMFQSSKDFFSQPTEVKETCARNKSIGNHGWVGLEVEKLNPDRPAGDLKECFNFTPSEDGSWPSDSFRSTFFSFFSDCKQLSMRVLDVLSIGLKLENKNFLSECHDLIGRKGCPTTLRSLYYPPLSECVKAGQVRCGEHSDYGAITLLFQDGIGGLEVMNTDDIYVPAHPVPGAVLVNIGDLMQRWTADKLKATKHRVLVPEAELKKRQSRQSLAFFVHPNDEVIIRCLDGSDKYEPISSIDYLNYRFNVTY